MKRAKYYSNIFAGVVHAKNHTTRQFTHKQFFILINDAKFK